MPGSTGYTGPDIAGTGFEDAVRFWHVGVEQNFVERDVTAFIEFEIDRADGLDIGFGSLLCVALKRG